MRTPAGSWLRAFLLGVLASAVIVSSGAEAEPSLGSASAPAKAISAGVDHACLLTGTGGVKCWGWNLFGQLGDRTTTTRLTPVPVFGLGRGVSAISAGVVHTCALTSAGGVECWGRNQFGELGDGTMTNRSIPVPVSGLGSGVSAIALGLFHTCALTSAGGVKCWGYNDFGQLGDGTRTNSSVPVAVSGLVGGVTAIAAGGYYTCALTSAGGVKCWGWNGSGQLGDGTTTMRLTPVDVAGLGGSVAELSSGAGHTCASTGVGGVECWGSNGYGQLGDGTTTTRLTPVDISGLGSAVSAIDAGGAHTCALTSAGSVKCWGSNAHGQLGDGTMRDRHAPVAVVGFGGSAPCVVPDVVGKPLAKAKTRIVHAFCRVGSVKWISSPKKKGTVVTQSPRPNKRLTKGARVNLRVSRGR
jgi:alpha-tubulin suppressor-like RCC1 family protein